MYGNGRPGPTASGVSTGKIWRWKRSSSAARSLGVDARRRDDADAVLGERRAQLVVAAARAWRSMLLAHALADRVERLARRAAVRRGVVDAGVDLVVQAGDADMKNSSRFEREDREELHALEQRHARRPRRAPARAR